jgi:hypothetical protein
MAMTKKQIQKRAAAIRSELVRMSRNSWRDARYDDYHPLEVELAALMDAARAKGKSAGARA